MYFFNLWQVKKVKKVFSTFPDAHHRYKTEDTGRLGSRVTADRVRPLLEYLRDNHGFAVDSFQVYNYQRPETLKSSVNFPASRMVAGISAAPTQFLDSRMPTIISSLKAGTIRYAVSTSGKVPKCR